MEGGNHEKALDLYLWNVAKWYVAMAHYTRPVPHNAGHFIGTMVGGISSGGGSRLPNQALWSTHIRGQEFIESY